MKRWPIFVSGLLGAVVMAGAQPTPRAAGAESDEARSSFSASRRFLMTGFNPAAAAGIGAWAEDVADRVASWLGAIPWERGEYVEIQAASTGSWMRAQGWVDGQLHQRLAVGRAAQEDQEDLLEGLVWLLMNRWPIRRQSTAQREEHLAVVPDWLATGLAQQLYPELRTRNAEVVLNRWRAGSLQAWSDMVERELLPPGRWAVKAESALLVAWLLERHISWDAIWEGCAAGRRWSADAVAREIAGFPDVAAAARHWETWLAGQRDHWRGQTDSSSLAADTVQAYLRFEELDRLTAGAPVQAPFGLRELILARDQPWVARLASQRSIQIQMAAVGFDSEWQDVVRRYVNVLESLAAPPRRGWKKWLGSRADSDRLLEELADADQARSLLMTTQRERSRFLDAVENGRASDAASPEASAISRVLDRMEADQMAPRVPAGVSRDPGAQKQ